MIGAAIVQSPAWAPRKTEIRITLGEFCIARIRFRAVTLPELDWRYPVSIADSEIACQLRSGLEVVYLPSFPIAEALPRLSVRNYGICYVAAHFRRYYVDLDGTFHDYLGRLGSKSRNTLSRHLRKFAEASGGAIDFRQYHTPGEITEFYELATRVSVKTYQHKLLKSGLLQTETFRRQLLELAEAGRVWGCLLFHQNTPVAYMYNTAYREILTSQAIGYDPDFRRYAPGTVLQYKVLERTFSDRLFRVFDFGSGEAFHKDFFSTGAASCAAVYYFAYTPKNLAFLAAHLGTSRVSAWTVNALSKLRINDWVKRIFRRVG